MLKLLWLVWMFAGLGLEIWALANRAEGDTLSELVWNYTKKYPLIPLAFGVLAGHFFWNRANY